MLLTIRNRWSKPFTGMYNGVEYTIAPGKEVTLPEYEARHLRRQSLFRDNPITGEQEYRLAVLEDGDPTDSVDEIPQESLDRTDMDMPRVEYHSTHIKTAVPTSKGPAERLGSLPR